MRCLNCGGRFGNQRGSLKIDNKIIGPFSVNDVEYDKCYDCGRLCYPAETAKIIEEKREKIRLARIGKLPVSEFISAIEAANILGISKQAFNKHRRVKRGFIYSFESNGRRIYHKKSVELFKETEDGRFPLNDQPTLIEIKYVSTQKQITDVPSWDRIHSENREKIKSFYNYTGMIIETWETGKTLPRLN